MTTEKVHTISGVSEEGFHHLVYSEWGDANINYPPVICIHGLARNRKDFNALAKFLSERGRHVFCLDIVGRGDSDWFKVPRHYNFIQYINDVNVLISRIDANQVDFIGTSMGGLIGMMMGALPKSPVNRLVMNDIGPQIPVKALWRMAKYMGKVHEFKTIEKAKAYFKLIYADFGIEREEQWDEFTANSITKRADNRYVVKLDPEIKSSNKPVYEFFKGLLSHPHKALEGVLFDIDLWSVWQQVKCPVMVIRGDRSDLLLPEYVEKMQQSNQHTTLMTVANAGHAPALLKQKEHEAILNWLEL